MIKVFLKDLIWGCAKVFGVVKAPLNRKPNCRMFGNVPTLREERLLNEMLTTQRKVMTVLTERPITSRVRYARIETPNLDRFEDCFGIPLEHKGRKVFLGSR